MAWHLYIIPAIGNGTKDDPRRPKYIQALGVEWSGMDYGFQPTFLAAADVDALQHAGLIAQPDCASLPDDLDANPSLTQVTAAQNFLETQHIPAGWITTALTWRQIGRIIIGLFLFMQRLSAFVGAVEIINGITVTLGTRFNELSLDRRRALVDAAASLNYDTSSLTATSTLREMLKAMADQWQGGSVSVGEITL